MNRVSLFASVSITTFIMTGAAWAQSAQVPASDASARDSAAAPAAATGSPVNKIGEVVVTANRRAQNLQTVPVSVTSIKGEVLQEKGVANAIDLPQLAPGLAVSRTLASANAYLRGIGTNSSGFTTETSVGVYLDGLYLPNSAAAVFSFNNIDRIEVLKGPQGTLYGRNTTGGLISVITRDPERAPALDVSGGLGNYSTYTGSLYATTPITDTLAGNVSVNYSNQQQGYDHNVITGKNDLKTKDLGLQGKLVWTPVIGTKISLRGFYDDLRTDAGLAAMVFPGSVGSDGTPFIGKRVNADRRDESLTQRQYNVSLKVEQDLGFANLTSLTGLLHNRASMASNQSPYPGNPIRGQSAVYLDGNTTDSTFEQEIQLTSKHSDKLQWIVGAFYYRDHEKIIADVYGTCIGSVCASSPPPVRTIAYPLTRSIAGYGEATYSFTTDTRLTLGVRYTSDRKTLSGIFEPLAGRPNSFPFTRFPPGAAITYPGQPYPGNPNGIPTSFTNSQPTYRAALAHDFTGDVHGYLSYNRGFRSGGYNPISFTNPPARPEVLDAYAVGVKTFLFEHRLRFNTEAFYYNYKDMQLRTTAPPAPPGGTILYNAAASHIKGVDADFAWAATSALTINGGVEVLDAKFVKFPGGACTVPLPIAGAILGGNTTVPCNLVGRHLPQAPRLSLNLGANYTIHTQAGDYALSINDSFQSKQYWDPDNRLSEKAHQLVNASLTWTPPGERFSAQLYARNLFDQYYYAGVAEGSSDGLVPGAPRTYGVTLRYRY